MNSNTLPYSHINSRDLAKRLILLASIASSLGACGVKLGSSVVLGTTSFLEEANRGAHAQEFQEHINANDKAQLQAKLNEVN
jgi:hypothetical protein